MVKAVFLDFYGTVVHEDGEVIREITKVIMETGNVRDGKRIGAFWRNEFQTLIMKEVLAWPDILWNSESLWGIGRSYSVRQALSL